MRLLTDATAAITDTYDYDAFGNLISRMGTTPNDYLYTGEQFDANLGFYCLRARYLSPSSGRFWTLDSFEGRIKDPLTLHKYLYTGANPINRIDPSGNVMLGETVIVTQVNATLSAIVNIAAFILFETIKKKLNEDSNLFIYREGNPNTPKSVALNRESDWRTGLSFSVKRPSSVHVKYRTLKLLIAGYAVFPDGGRQFTDLETGLPYGDAIARPDHVSVFIPDKQRWDAWYNEELGYKGQPVYSEETLALYNLRELIDF